MNHLKLSDYVAKYEGEEIFPFLQSIWERMKLTVREGLAQEGTLPGGLDVQKKAYFLYFYVAAKIHQKDS